MVNQHLLGITCKVVKTCIEICKLKQIIMVCQITTLSRVNLSVGINLVRPSMSVTQWRICFHRTLKIGVSSGNLNIKC
jgi:hypothetical protein